MGNFVSKFVWAIWKNHYALAKKIKLGNSVEEFSIVSIFLTTVFYTLGISSLFFFFRFEAKYSLDTKILGLLLFFIISGVQILYLFNRKKNYLKLENGNFSFRQIILIFLLWVLIFLILGLAMIYDFFDGNINTLIYYLKIHYCK
ncbi:hypothetical protein D9V84_06865 [Bacteroidetes/Chlorobi group bacterium Naka2016]|jgi:hypothetical protein|nr:MAG: hypothetical protein D9V84_06865 [Bacteroidetes/Chlorobi group bacterium Naka2016]